MHHSVVRHMCAKNHEDAVVTTMRVSRYMRIMGSLSQSNLRTAELNLSPNVEEAHAGRAHASPALK